jgi:hypothetical protein
LSSREDTPLIPHRWREAIIFVVAIGGIIQQTVIAESPNAILMGAFVSMLGLPLVLNRDERKRKPEDEEKP